MPARLSVLARAFCVKRSIDSMGNAYARQTRQTRQTSQTSQTSQARQTSQASQARQSRPARQNRTAIDAKNTKRNWALRQNPVVEQVKKVKNTRITRHNYACLLQTMHNDALASTSQARCKHATHCGSQFLNHTFREILNEPNPHSGTRTTLIP